MSSFTGAATSALRATRTAGIDRARINPVLLLGAPQEEEALLAGGGPEADPDQVALLTEWATAPALLTISVVTEAGTSRRRIAVDPRRGVVEESLPGTGTSRWTSVAPAELLDAVREPLGTTPAFDAAPLLTQEDAAALLRLTGSQQADLRSRIARGESPSEAAAGLQGVDPRMRDALMTSAPRASLSLTLHDPTRIVIERPVPWARAWTLGDLGLYRADPSREGVLSVLPVADGDVLGSAVPLLDQALRFTAAVHAARGATAPRSAR